MAPYSETLSRHHGARLIDVKMTDGQPNPFPAMVDGQGPVDFHTPHVAHDGKMRAAAFAHAFATPAGAALAELERQRDPFRPIVELTPEGRRNWHATGASSSRSAPLGL